MRKLVGVGEYVKGGFGGVNLHIFYILKYFRENRAKADVDLEAFHLPRDVLRKISTVLLFLNKSGINIYSVFRREMLSKYDIVHSHGSVLVNSIAIKMQKDGKKFILTLHGYPSREHVREVYSKDTVYWRVFWSNYYEVLLSQTQLADCVITVTEWIKKKLKKELDVDAVVIPNMIDPKDVQLLAKNYKSILDHFNLKEKEYIAWLGARIYPVNCKRPQDFIELARRFPDDMFVMAGKGIDEAGLRRHLKLRKSEIPKNLKLINTSNYPKHREIFLSVLKGAKFGILTSFQEAFGYVILESLSLGVPVIVPNSGGPPEIVNKKTGMVYKTKDVDDLTKKNEKMKARYMLFDEEELHKYVKQNYNYTKIVPNIFEIYRSI